MTRGHARKGTDRNTGVYCVGTPVGKHVGIYCGTINDSAKAGSLVCHDETLRRARGLSPRYVVVVGSAVRLLQLEHAGCRPATSLSLSGGQTVTVGSGG